MASKESLFESSNLQFIQNSNGIESDFKKLSLDEQKLYLEQLETLSKKLRTLLSPSQDENTSSCSISKDISDRIASISRTTKETEISVSVNLDGQGKSNINTGLGFLDHMLTALSKHSMIDIDLQCKGDIHVDDHHTAEDCALALGTCIDKALGPTKAGIYRYGSAYAPLDEALARAVVDISGRPSASIKLALVRQSIGNISTEMLTHFLQSLAMASKITLHVTVLEGENDHHKSEAAFKALALALGQAISLNPKRSNEIPSTKGTLS